MVFHWPSYGVRSQNKCEWMTGYLKGDAFFQTGGTYMDNYFHDQTGPEFAKHGYRC